MGPRGRSGQRRFEATDRCTAAVCYELTLWSFANASSFVIVWTILGLQQSRIGQQTFPQVPQVGPNRQRIGTHSLHQRRAGTVETLVSPQGTAEVELRADDCAETGSQGLPQVLLRRALHIARGSNLSQTAVDDVPTIYVDRGIALLEQIPQSSSVNQLMEGAVVNFAGCNIN